MFFYMALTPISTSSGLRVNTSKSTYTFTSVYMIHNKIAKVNISPIRLHSASSVRICCSVNNVRNMLPTIRLSPPGSFIIRKYSKPFNAFKRRGMYANVSKCYAKKCVCCTHLCTKNTITSSINGWQFSIINNNDLDWTSSDLVCVITWTTNCCMPYVRQTGRSLKTRFCEYFHKMKKPNKNDSFLYRHSKHTGHIMIQPVEKIINDPNCSSKFKNIKRHENELKWITFLQSPLPLRFIIYIMKVIFLDCLISMFSLFWNVRHVKLDLMVYEWMATLNTKQCRKGYTYFSKGSFSCFK